VVSVLKLQCKPCLTLASPAWFRRGYLKSKSWKDWGRPKGDDLANAYQEDYEEQADKNLSEGISSSQPVRAGEIQGIPENNIR
jgi:hypothetical protein